MSNQTLSTIQCLMSPSQLQTIQTRAQENGFDDVAVYLKVTALKTQAFKISPAGMENETSSETIDFNVNEAERAKIEELAKESGSETISQYVIYAALHAVVTAVVEVRSTGSFDDMLQRIAAKKGK